MKGINHEEGSDLLGEGNKRIPKRGGKGEKRKWTQESTGDQKEACGGSRGRRKEVGLRTGGAMGAGGQRCELGRERNPEVAGSGPGGTPGLPEVPEGENSDCRAKDPEKRGREARGRLPRHRQAPPGRAAEVSGVQRGSYRARLRERGGRDTHEFLGFAAVASRRRQFIRAPTLLLVPGPTAGPRAPTGRLHVRVRAGH